MANESKPIRVQFSIGKTSSLDLQEWAKNQTLPISKAVREALEHFVRIHGTHDLRSPEVRNRLNGQAPIPQQSKDIETKVTNPIEKETVEEIDNDSVEEQAINKPKKVMERKINITS